MAIKLNMNKYQITEYRFIAKINKKCTLVRHD